MRKFIIFTLTAFVFTLVCNAQTEPPFHQEGVASWYGTEFDGMPTASSEIFDSSQFTAAHPKLPFGTLLIVTNQLNNKKVTVRINDRGPFIPNRIIDLSKAAAEQLGIIPANTVPVVLDIAPKDTPLGPFAGTAPQTAQTPVTPPVDQSAPPPPVTTTPPPSTTPQTTTPPPITTAPETPVVTTQTPPPSQILPPITSSAKPANIKPALPLPGTNKKYRLQVGSYKVPKNAIEAFDKLKNAGLNPSYERYGELYRVVLSGVKSDDVKSVAEKIGQAGFSEALIKEEP
jgi:rare lipoprotein A